MPRLIAVADHLQRKGRLKVGLGRSNHLEANGVADRLRSSNSAFKGGIGVYPSSRVVHIDTRGTNANWTG